VTWVFVPASPSAARSRYVKVRDRLSYAFALASCAVGLDVHDGRIQSARIALGGVGTKPWRCPEAERSLIGAPPRRDTFRAAADLALRDARPRPDNLFKVELAKRTIVRALTLCAEAA
jgi:xanthine dehydrogenase YagS FAD-binding subunit